VADRAAAPGCCAGADEPRPAGRTPGQFADTAAFALGRPARTSVTSSYCDLGHAREDPLGEEGQHPSPATVMRMLDEHDQKAAAAG
jgi:hypothetical protein